MDIADPIAEAEARLSRVLEGAEAGVHVGRAQQAVHEAKADSESRGVGLGLIQSRPLRGGGDGEEYLVVVSEGARRAVIVAQLTGTATAAAEAQGEDPGEHLLERMRGAVGTLPNDGHRYENVILNHPAMYSS